MRSPIDYSGTAIKNLSGQAAATFTNSWSPSAARRRPRRARPADLRPAPPDQLRRHRVRPAAAAAAADHVPRRQPGRRLDPRLDRLDHPQGQPHASWYAITVTLDGGAPQDPPVRRRRLVHDTLLGDLRRRHVHDHRDDGRRLQPAPSRSRPSSRSSRRGSGHRRRGAARQRRRGRRHRQRELARRDVLRPRDHPHRPSHRAAAPLPVQPAASRTRSPRRGSATGLRSTSSAACSTSSSRTLPSTVTPVDLRGRRRVDDGADAALTRACLTARRTARSATRANTVHILTRHLSYFALFVPFATSSPSRSSAPCASRGASTSTSAPGSRSRSPQRSPPASTARRASS